MSQIFTNPSPSLHRAKQNTWMCSLAFTKMAIMQRHIPASMFVDLYGMEYSMRCDYLLPLRAVAVHAAVGGFSASLPVHGRASSRVLHCHARLHTPLDAAAAGLAPFLACWRLCGKHTQAVSGPVPLGHLRYQLLLVQSVIGLQLDNRNS